MSENAFTVKNLKKHFLIPKSTRSKAMSHLAGTLFGSDVFYTRKVLDDISFEIKKGECFGIIGPNGSGKSTMMKMLAGVMYPDSGTIQSEGTIVPLLNLGVGFSADLNARDNIFQYGAILGLSDEYLEEKYDDIIKFAELKASEYQKLKHFSSGMRVRLGFSVAIQIDPDIILLDEVLSVGDISFREKSYQKILEFCTSGKTIVLVSHSPQTIETLCDRAMFIRNGKLGGIGKPKEVLATYMKFMEKQHRLDRVPEPAIPEGGAGRGIAGLPRGTEELDIPTIVSLVKGECYPYKVEKTLLDVFSSNYLKPFQGERIGITSLGTALEESPLGEDWTHIFTELGEESKSRSLAGAIIRSMSPQGVINAVSSGHWTPFTPEQLPARQSKRTFYKRVEPLKTVIISNSEQKIPLVYNARLGLHTNQVFIDRYREELENFPGGTLVLNSELYSNQFLAMCMDQGIPFISRLPNYDIESSTGLLSFLENIRNIGNMIKSGNSTIFSGRTGFPIEGKELDAFCYFDPDRLSSEYTHFYRHLLGLKEHFNKIPIAPDHDPARMLKYIAGSYSRFLGLDSEVHRVTIDDQAVKGAQNAFGYRVLLNSSGWDMIRCYRESEFQEKFEQCINFYAQILHEIRPLVRGRILYSMILISAGKGSGIFRHSMEHLGTPGDSIDVLYDLGE